MVEQQNNQSKSL